MESIMQYVKGEINMLEFIHSDKYSDAIKVAKKFTSTNTNRPSLIFVHHSKDGSIEATDSHRLIRIKNIHGFDKDYLVHPNTLEFATGHYPEINQMVETNQGETTIRLNKEQLKIWLQMHRSLNQLVNRTYYKNKPVTLSVEDELKISIIDTDDSPNNISIDLPYEIYNNTLKDEDLPSVNYNAAYMRDCLEAHEKMGSEYVDIVINHPFKPMLITNVIEGNRSIHDVDCILTVVRTY